MDNTIAYQNEKASARLVVAHLTVAAALLLVLALRYWQFTVDDAYISLRYAQNLVSGNGLVFNVGERVEGFTNLTWTLLGAGILQVGIEPTVALKIVGLICALLTIWVCLLIFRHLEPQRPAFGWLVVLLIATAPCIVAWSVAGMETMLFALMLSSTFYVYLSGKALAGWPLWPILALLTIMTRPEGMLIVPILVVHGALSTATHQRQRLLGATLVFVLLLGVFLLWRLLYYGDIVPNTYYAKVAGNGWGTALGGARYLMEFARSYCGPVAVGLLGSAVMLTRRRSSVLLLLATVGAYFLTPLMLGSDWMPQFRYLAPYWPLATVLIAIGTARIADLISSEIPGNQHYRVRLAVGMSVLVAFGLLYAYQIVLAYNPGGKHYGHYGINVGYHADATRKYAKAGRRLAEIAQPDDTLAAFAIGAIGYYCDIYIIDACGLVDKKIARQKWPQRLRYILSMQPTYIEDLSTEATTSGLTVLPEFRENYRRLSNEPIDSRLYVRKGVTR